MYWPVRPSEIGRYFFRYEIGGLYVPVCLLVRYIRTVPARTVRNRLPCFWVNFVMWLYVKTSFTLLYVCVFVSHTINNNNNNNNNYNDLWVDFLVCLCVRTSFTLPHVCVCLFLIIIIIIIIIIIVIGATLMCKGYIFKFEAYS